MPKSTPTKNQEALPAEREPVVLRFAPLLSRLSKDDYFRFCQANELWLLELSKEGDLIVWPLQGADISRRNAKLTGLFGEWSEADGTGIGFGSCTGFTLPNGAVRAPDLSWLKKERWQALTKKEREQFAPLCPDFVVELRSYTDPLKWLQAKMEEYLENGALLGWLIDPIKRKVYIYRPHQSVECLKNPQELSGENVLPGLMLPVTRLWED